MRQLAIVAAVSVLAGAIAWPALAADVRAGADTPAGKAGQVILDAAKGQTYIEAFARTNSPTNPFGVDLAGVAGAIGAKGRCISCKVSAWPTNRYPPGTRQLDNFPKMRSCVGRSK